MKSKKAAVTTLVAVGTVIVGVNCVMLFVVRGWWSTAKNGIETQKVMLTSSVARYPYPSATTIVAISNNVRTLEEDAALLRKDMNAGQMPVEAGMEPLTWLSLLTRRKRDLQGVARTASIRLPPKFPFGFERYDGGNPPKVSDVRRLDLQLKTIEQLCKIAYQSGISELTSITREQFEDQNVSQGATHGGSAGATAVSNEVPLFTKEHLTIRLRARETALIDLLNSLASSKLFSVVTLVRVTADSGVELRLATRGGDDAESGHKPDVGSDDESLSAKVITGRGKEKPADVVLELDVYEFGESLRGPS